MSEEQEGQVPQNPDQGQPFAKQPFEGNAFPPKGGNFGYEGMQLPLPNATAVLVMGILSIVTCCCFYGIISLILGIIAIVLGNKDTRLYLANVGMYTESSYKNLRAGRICAIIGLVLSAITLIACVIIIVTFGFDVLRNQEAMKDLIMEMQNR
ncbi:CCC motif membrane protein [Pedobacter sp.]